MALSRDDCGNRDVVGTHSVPHYWCIHLHLLTFPAPTGPITARSCCGLTAMEMSLSDGASIH